MEQKLKKNRFLHPVHRHRGCLTCRHRYLCLSIDTTCTMTTAATAVPELAAVTLPEWGACRLQLLQFVHSCCGAAPTSRVQTPPTVQRTRISPAAITPFPASTALTPRVHRAPPLRRRRKSTAAHRGSGRAAARCAIFWLHRAAAAMAAAARRTVLRQGRSCGGRAAGRYFAIAQVAACRPPAYAGGPREGGRRGIVRGSAFAAAAGGGVLARY